MNFLEEIISYKKIEVDKAKNKLPLEKLKKATSQQVHDKRNFFQTVKNKIEKKEIALITEIKKASPSKGIIKRNFNHIEIAKAYERGGASCLSVLTDEKYFQGSLQFIPRIKETVKLPVLRKDFIIDPYQIYESILVRADCILLIVSALDKDLMKKLFDITMENNLDCLLEVHDEKEMECALDIACSDKNLPVMIGINNRDLKTFEVRLETTKQLVIKYLRDVRDKVLISESGIVTHQDISYLADSGVYAFLVGESLVKESDIEKATKQLINK